MTARRPLAVLLGIVALTGIGGCARLAIESAPPKRPASATSELAKLAVRTFWDEFLEARHDEIPKIRRLLTAAYLEQPRDPQLALLLAHTHLWAVAERHRTARIGPEVTDHLILAERYFEEAHRLAPDDPRIPGWLGGVKMALGRVHGDERRGREGYYMTRAAAAAYPEFGLFTHSYVLSSRPADSWQFREAVEYAWRNVDVCLDARVDRERPRFDTALARAAPTSTGPKRVCWNTALVPHNVEGFFLHLGDVLLKNGAREAARAAYGVVQASPGYATWRYQPALEARLANADDWMRRLRDADAGNDPPFLFESPMACVACHAR